MNEPEGGDLGEDESSRDRSPIDVSYGAPSPRPSLHVQRRQRIHEILREAIEEEEDDELPGIRPYSPKDNEKSFQIMKNKIQELKVSGDIQDSLIKAFAKGNMRQKFRRTAF